MASVINTNMASLVAQRNLSSAQSTLATSVQRLSSGLRINSGKDDAAGLAVAQKMALQARSMNVAARNANDGISMIQTAEGVASTVNDIFLRMRDLATQASNDSLNSTQRGYIATEIGQLRSEAENMVSRTKFNGKVLLNGSMGLSTTTASGVKVGNLNGSSAGVVAIDVSEATAGKTYTLSNTSGTISAFETTGTVIATAAAATATLSAATPNSTQTLDLSAIGIKVVLNVTDTYTAANLGSALVTTATAATIAIASVGGSATLQVGADNATDNTMSLSFMDMRITDGTNADLSVLATKLDAFQTGATRDNATNLMDALDNALTSLNSNRAKMGAWQNRLDFNVSSLNIAEENTRASMSRIQDTDYAAETASLTKGQILQQAGAAMLSQANQMPNVILSLLK